MLVRAKLLLHFLSRGAFWTNPSSLKCVGKLASADASLRRQAVGRTVALHLLPFSLLTCSISFLNILYPIVFAGFSSSRFRQARKQKPLRQATAYAQRSHTHSGRHTRYTAVKSQDDLSIQSMTKILKAYLPHTHEVDAALTHIE